MKLPAILLAILAASSAYALPTEPASLAPATLKGMLSDPPEPDRSLPQALLLQDRKLEDLIAFGLNGDPNGIEGLCIHYFHSDAAGSVEQAHKWCGKGADWGSGGALRILGELHLSGKGVPADPAAAVQLFQRASLYQDKVAHFRLYQAYRDGKGVTADAAAAHRYLVMAADAGHAPAMAALAEAGDPWRPSPEAAALARDEEQGKIVIKAAAGEVLTRSYRFDEKRSRELRFTLKAPQHDPDWGPLGNICLVAEAPSERLCVRLAALLPDHAALRASKRFSSAKGQLLAEQVLPANLAAGLPHKVRVYVAGSVAHFIADDALHFEQRISYPAELLELSCSTATCHFDFDVAPAAAGQ